jgi:hypothetical protein
VSQIYSTVCKMDMSVIMYCYCSFISSGTALLTTLRAEFLRTLLLTLDKEEGPTSPSSSCCRELVYPGWPSTGAWSAIALNADSRLSSVINIYLLDKEIDICNDRTFSILQKLKLICPFVLHVDTWRCGFTVPLIFNLCSIWVCSFTGLQFHKGKETSVLTEQFLKFWKSAEYRW